MKFIRAIAALFFSTIAFASGANYIVTNVSIGPGDTLYANSSNTLLSSNSVVTIGYFSSGFDVSGNLTNLTALLGAYTEVASAAPGTNSATLGGSFDGYVEGPTVDGTPLLGANALIGLSLYSFIGDASSLASSAEFALISIGTLQEDSPNEFTYIADPTSQAVLIGGSGIFNGDAGAGSGIYNTLQTQAVPEPSVLLLSAFGVLALLRRKR
jgi:hypothetical protein